MGLTQTKIKGIIEDFRTGELLADANIYLKSERTVSAFSDLRGSFQLPVRVTGNERKDVLVISCAGYQRYQKKIDIREGKDQLLHVKLKKRLLASDRTEDDKALVKNALNGDQQAYGKLMGRYRDSIFFMIQKMVNNRDDAEDLTIEAFGKAFHRLHKYSTDYAFSTWLYRIAINNTIDHVRKKRLNTLSLDEPFSNNEGSQASRDVQSKGLDPEERYIKDQRILMMRKAIERLSAKYRKLIELRYLRELSYGEIAEELGLPLGTVKAQLHRAKDLMHNMMVHSKDAI